MASRYFQQFFFSLNNMPVWLEGSCAIGASGAVSSITGSGIATIIKEDGTGQYRVKLQDAYYRFLEANITASGGVTGAAVAGGSFVPGTLYQIVSLGTTTQEDWEAAGLPAGVPAAAGVPFVASDIGAGSGTVKALASSGVAFAEVAANAQQTVNQKVYPYMIVSCYDSAGALVDPANGSTLYFSFCLRNSSTKGKGE